MQKIGPTESSQFKPRPLAVIRNRRLNSVALLDPLRSVQFSSERIIIFKVQSGYIYIFKVQSGHYSRPCIELICPGGST